MGTTRKEFDREMRRKGSEYNKLADVDVFAGTWNVKAGICIDGTDLLPWLLGDETDDESKERQSPADVYVIALQEIVDLNNPLNVALDCLGPSASQMMTWRESLSKALQEIVPSSKKSASMRDERSSIRHYTLIADANLVGIALFVFVRGSLAQYITDVRISVCGVGFLGVMGNKGAVAISLVLHDTPICFISSHLSAGRENIEKRNIDAQAILDRMEFCTSSQQAFYSEKDDIDASATAFSFSTSSSSSSNSPLHKNPSQKINNIPQHVENARSELQDSSIPLQFESQHSTSNPKSPFTTDSSSFYGYTLPAGLELYPTSLLSYPLYTATTVISLASIPISSAINTFFPSDTATGSIYQRLARPWHLSFETQAMEKRKIADHEVIFWLGDLNYHIVESVSTADIIRDIEACNFASLRQFDQLNKERALGNVFLGFDEGPLDFPPTYKFEVGDYTRLGIPKPGDGIAVKYVAKSSEIVKGSGNDRAPAWTDRILWIQRPPKCALADSVDDLRSGEVARGGDEGDNTKNE